MSNNHTHTTTNSSITTLSGCGWGGAGVQQFLAPVAPEAKIYLRKDKIVFKIEEEYWALDGENSKGAYEDDKYISASGLEIHLPIRDTKEEARRWWDVFVKDGWEKTEVKDLDKDDWFSLAESLQTANPCNSNIATVHAALNSTVNSQPSGLSIGSSCGGGWCVYRRFILSID